MKKLSACEPKPQPKPTMIVGGGGNKTMMLAARFADWWNIPDANFDVYRDRVSILKAHCATIGRDPDSLRLTWFGRLAVAESEAEAEALSGGKWTTERAIVGTPSQVVAQLQRFIEFGVDYFMVEVLGISQPTTMNLLVQEVLPKVQ